MKKILIFAVIAVSLFSCQSVKKERFNCNTPNYINGRVLYAIPTRTTRMVVLETENGKVIIHKVPMNVGLTNIPTCYKGHDIVYFHSK